MRPVLMVIKQAISVPFNDFVMGLRQNRVGLVPVVLRVRDVLNALMVSLDCLMVTFNIPMLTAIMPVIVVVVVALSEYVFTLQLFSCGVLV